ncbi:hypothetical protein QAD02_004379 [Eretmocerus hayati]|uniref:Uncharacterized protein n=1 Tax=Eretmocerus hayati TaxID=131215 RepID=A0ACC2NPS7_9HYME|nr:hypothetical protein QAD02_004379 [Eretmocerus hayati]
MSKIHSMLMRISSNVKDKLMPAKLSFCASVALVMELLLTQFRSHAPMVPFMYKELERMARTIMGRFVKREILEKNLLKKIDLKESNLISKELVDLGFETRGALQALPETLSVDKVSRFKQAEKRLILCLEELSLRKKVIAGYVADEIKQEFLVLCKSEALKIRFKQYCRSKTRLDHFWTEIISESEKDYPNNKVGSNDLHFVTRKCGFRAGFSINAQCVVENQSIECLVTMRQVYDGGKLLGDVDDVPIRKKIIHYARNASSLYQEHLQQERKEN